MITETLPVIDIRDLESPVTRRAIDAACRDWGFFQVENHGIEERTTLELRKQMREFFALPLAAKHAIMRTAENPWGFYDRELTKNTRDWKQIFDYGPPDGGAIVPQLPRELPAFERAIVRFYEECDALALELPAGALADCFRPNHTSFLRLNYYPPCPNPVRPTGLAVVRDGYLGVNQHTDSGALTLLLQDEQPGLEVFHEHAWHLVEPRRDALVVNIGDIVQVWSNTRYKAALHRGLASADAERFSAPFFFNPAYATEYAPLPSTVDAANPPRYQPIHWGRFRARRAAGDYADHGEYHSISHYSR
jgi:isopenicillin N synthase-like dioxygenase